MTLIKPLCLLTHTNVRWKRLLSAPELPSAVELASSTAMPAAAIHHVFLAFIRLPFFRTLHEATPRARVCGRTVRVFVPRDDSSRARFCQPKGVTPRRAAARRPVRSPEAG